MEITNEIKQKLIYQYFGQKYFYKNEFGTYGGIVGEYHTNEHIRNEFFVIRLKSLTEITNEDAIEVYDIVKDTELLDKAKKEHILFWFKNKTNGYIVSDWDITLQAFQFLQSKGYDLPQYLLGGKTLKEVGLAVYYK